MRLYSSWVSLVAICFVSFVFFTFGCSSDNATSPVGGDLDREVGADIEEFDTEVSSESDLEPAEEQDVTEEAEQAEESDFEPSDENLWNKLALHLDDPIQQGDVVRTAIDRPMLAGNSTGTAALTAFGWDSVNADEPYVWHVDLETGVHQRIFTTGDAFATGENFCMDEDWCQFIGYDPTGEEWLILGPQSSSLMWLKEQSDGTWESRLTAVSGTRPSNSAIDYSYTVDWSNRRLYIYGYSVPTGGGSRLYGLDIDQGEWTLIADDVPPVTSNGLVVANNMLYSFGGLTDDPQGSGELVTAGVVTTLNPEDGSFTSVALPEELASREKISCAWNESRGKIFVFGGATVRDYWDESQNDYHNDLWTYDPSSDSWAAWTLDFGGSTLAEPDEYGDRAFDGNPDGPDFGNHRSIMTYDSAQDRLILMGRVPRYTGEQIFFLDLTVFSP